MKVLTRKDQNEILKCLTMIIDQCVVHSVYTDTLADCFYDIAETVAGEKGVFDIMETMAEQAKARIVTALLGKECKEKRGEED